MKMMKKPFKRDVPGPLIEKKFLTNEKIIYYTKRYCPVVEGSIGVQGRQSLGGSFISPLRMEPLLL